ncbi:MAG: hypothetical protein EXR27_23215 [Betaproteobacteria bacterium]|nr:hypothetical protein [Betaproteobacteria bacterium]
MRPDPRAQPGYVEALTKIIAKMVASLGEVNPKRLPIMLYVAGGAALHLRTGSRVTADIDAVFSQRVLLGDDLEVSYRDADGRARLLYLDRNYNDTLGLMHENAYQDSEPVDLPGLDGKVIEVRALTPLDLAVSKLARYSDQDREDIEVLAREGLIDAKALRKRAEEAIGGYIGNVKSVQISIDLACKLVEAHRTVRKSRTPRR